MPFVFYRVLAVGEACHTYVTTSAQIMDTISPSDFLDEFDQAWGVNDEVTSQEWYKMDQDFSNVSHLHLVH